MNHNITVEKFSVRLRPVTMEDARFIFKIRRSSDLSQYIGEFDHRYDVHLTWLENYFQRENDYYFVIELSSGKPIGTIAIYDIEDRRGIWGRWIIQRPFPAAPASAWLMYHVAFDILQLSEISCQTVLKNTKTVSFHDHCGLRRTGMIPKGLTIQGISYDLVEHTASREDWNNIRKKLEAPARLAQRFLKKT